MGNSVLMGLEDGYDAGGARHVATPGFFLVAVSIFTACWRMMGGLLHLVLARDAQALAYGVVVEDQDHNGYVRGFFLEFDFGISVQIVGSGFGKQIGTGPAGWCYLHNTQDILLRYIAVASVISEREFRTPKKRTHSLSSEHHILDLNCLLVQS